MVAGEERAVLTAQILLSRSIVVFFVCFNNYTRALFTKRKWRLLDVEGGFFSFDGIFFIVLGGFGLGKRMGLCKK